MSSGKNISAIRLAVLGSAALMLSVWTLTNLAGLVGVQNGVVRFPLCLLLSLLILLRRKGRVIGRRKTWPAVVGAVAGAGAAVAGIVFRVHLLEWSGVLGLVGACLWWGLPDQRAGNLAAALSLLFFAHPIPSQVFAPLQFAMQYWSVAGSEWLLHVLNQRVWADGFVLHTGLSIYEVPAWCSGMRTATTVALVALGLGFLKRLSAQSCILLVLAALAQALVLNILRISAMVFFAPRIGPGAGMTFLHDTAGIIVLAGIGLVYLELMYLEHRREHQVRRRAELNPSWIEKLSEHPPIWRILIQNKWRILLILLVLGGVGELAWRSRPLHRAAMVRGVVEAFQESRQFALARKAAEQVRSVYRDDEQWALTILRILLLEGEYEKVLEGLDALPDGNPHFAAQKTILRAYSLMALDRLDEAVAEVHRLPEYIQASDPRVAMILAEMKYYAGDPEAVAQHVLMATNWGPNRDRIRDMYPYLRTHRKWDAITGSDSQESFTSLAPALCATEAYMNINDVPRVSELTANMVRRWPHDSRVLEPLFFLTAKFIDDNWESLFEAQFRRVVDRGTEVDALYLLFEKCYGLARPDLAWHLHERLSELDAGHPALLLNAVLNARRWFVFRKQYVGYQSSRATELIDIRSLYRYGCSLVGWRDACVSVPLGEVLSLRDTVENRKKLLVQAVEAFARRKAEGRLSLSMQYLYVRAMEISDDIDGAVQQLADIREAFPAEQESCRILLSEIYERKARWQDVYEVLRDYSSGDNPQLTPLLRLVNAQTQMRLGFAAVETAQLACRLYPKSSKAIETLAAALSRFDSPDEALLVLHRPRVRDTMSLTFLHARVLHRSQRFNESRRISRSAFMSPLPIPSGTVQRPYLAPAEASVLRHQMALPSQKDFERTAAILESNRESNTSPFLLHLTERWLAAWHGECKALTVDPDLWMQGGRDEVEKAVLLNQLCLLLCRAGDWDRARLVAVHAARQLPDSALLWRMAVSLCRGSRDVLAEARAACPQDSELWLADLVLTTQIVKGMLSEPETSYSSVTVEALPEDMAEWVLACAEAAVASDVYSPAAMTRAADYCFRGELKVAACLLSYAAAQQAEGLLPVYVQALRCAIEEQDAVRAMRYTRQAIEAALHPPAVLYEKYVGLKAANDPVATDNDMVEALKVLRQEEPDDQLWAQMLGYVRFQRGGWEVIDALFQMTDAIQHGATNRTPYVIAAESARLLDRYDRAAELLRQGLGLFPGDTELLNNLTYTLAQDKETIEQALDLLPGLLQKAREDVRILDTASTVYTRSGLVDKAEIIVKEILSRVNQGSRFWFRASVRAAEVSYLRGESGAAAEALRELVRKCGDMPDEDILSATRLMEEVEKSILRESGPTSGRRVRL